MSSIEGTLTTLLETNYHHTRCALSDGSGSGQEHNLVDEVGSSSDADEPTLVFFLFHTYLGVEVGGGAGSYTRLSIFLDSLRIGAIDRWS